VFIKKREAVRKIEKVYNEVFEVIWSRREAQTVDALAVRGEEGRVILRKAVGSWNRALSHRYPNGGTRPRDRSSAL
jgi:hypothetical protein